MPSQAPLGEQPLVGVFSTDAALRVQTWDEALARMTGRSAAEVVGRSLAELFPELASRGLLARFKRVVQTGVVEVLAPALHQFLFACPPARPSARFTHMQQSVRIAPLREGENIVGVLVTIEDVTARRERELDLAERLGSPDEAVRAAAAREMGAMDGEVGTELVRAMGDASWRVRRAAVDGLSRRAGAQTVARVLRALREQHQDIGVLNSALSVLAMSDLDVVTPLTEMLADRDAAVRTYAALALGLQQDRRAVRPLLDALADADANVRYHAIEALGRLRAAEAVEALMAIVESRDFFLAFPALDALMQIGDLSVAPRLVGLLEDDLLRGPAVEALGRLGDAASVPPLMAVLDRPGAPVAAVVRALVSLHDHYELAYHEGAHIADLVRQHARPGVVAALLAFLESAGDEELGGLVRVLGWLESPDADRALAQLLTRPQVRREVVEALVRHGRRVTGLLLAQLKADAVEVRHAAVAALGRIGDPQAVPALLQLLQEEDELLVVTAGALARIGDPRALDGLLGLLSHPDAAVRQAAIAGLNSLGHPDLPARVEALLSDPNPLNRESAARIAGYFGYDNCADRLFALCRDPDEAVRRAAVEGVAMLDDPRVPGTLLTALAEETPRVRAAAAQALAQVPGPATARALLAALEDNDAWVRYHAAQSLGRLGVVESFEALTRLAGNDPAGHVRAAAMQALGQMGGARAAAALASMVESPNPDLARAAIAALGKVGHPDALPPLLAAARSKRPELRLDAVRALGERGGVGVAGALQWVAAADSQPAVAQAALDALARLATPEAAAALVALCADASRREAAVTALVQMGQKGLEAAVQGLTHPQPGVRLAVVSALARLKHPRASECLVRALSDSDSGVRLAAVTALGRLGSRFAERNLARLAQEDPDPAVRRAAREALKT